VILHRRFLTLIEILIVISILAIVTGLVGLNIRRALINQRFNTEVGLLADHIRLAQDMMLILSKDVHLFMQGTPEGIEYWLEVEGGASGAWEPVIKRAHRKMQSTFYADFKQEDLFPLSRQGIIELRFLSKGSMMSRGELQLSTHEDPFSGVAARRTICLKGYPDPIFSIPVNKIPTPNEMWSDCEEKKEKEDFFEQLTRSTQEEILREIEFQKARNGTEKKEEEPKEPSNGEKNAIPRS
jgi:type II secretory pathway pseudopilin PulG